MDRRIGALVAALILAVPTAGLADHESMPVWPPLFNVQPVTVVGTGNTVCGPQSVSGTPATLEEDLRTGRMTGTVAASSVVACNTSVPVRVVMSVAIYHDKASGHLDPSTLPSTDVRILEMRTINSCEQVITAPTTMACSTPIVGFDLAPGSRYVAVSAATYELRDPLGGAWFVIVPPACRAMNVRSKAYCLVAADFRA